MKTKKLLALLLCTLLLCALFSVSAMATSEVTDGFDKVVTPVVTLMENLLRPLLAVITAAGSLYCVLLGVKYAKAEEPQEREKAKSHLKNAIIGFVLIFVLILALNLLKDPMINWVNQNAGKTIIS